MKIFAKVLIILGVIGLYVGASYADVNPSNVIQVPNVSYISGHNLSGSSYANLSLAGYNSAQDGGGGALQQISSPTVLTLTATTTTGTNVLTSLSANPNALKWGKGFLITDSAGRLPTNTVITSITADGSSITLSQNVTGHSTGDTITVNCNNGGTIFKDNSGTCFARNTPNGSLQAFGLVNGSVYDANANPLTVSDAIPKVNLAINVLAAAGIKNLQFNQTSLYFASSLLLPLASSIDCGYQSGAPYSGGNYLGRPATIFLNHASPIVVGSNSDNSPVQDCLILPYWLQKPSEAVSDCILNGVHGQSFTSLPEVYADLDSIRANMTICGDTALFINKSSGATYNNLTILGFDQPIEASGADHTIFNNVSVDGNIGAYSLNGGGITYFENYTVDVPLTKQVYLNGILGTTPTTKGCVQNTVGGTLVCNEEGWKISNIVAASGTNSFGRHYCELSLTSASTFFNTNDIQTSQVNAIGDPITFPMYIANLNDTGSSITGAVSCLSSGPQAATLISASVDGTTATIDLPYSEIGTGADVITSTATWIAGSNILRIVSGNIAALQPGEIVSDLASGANGIPVGTKILVPVRNVYGADPGDGYISEVVVDHTLTATKTADTNITFDAQAFVTNANPCVLNSGPPCAFYNASEKYTAGASTGGIASSMLQSSKGHPTATGFLVNGTASAVFDNVFSFGHKNDYVVQDANNNTFSAAGSDNNGELNTLGKTVYQMNGSANHATIFGYQAGKGDVPIINDNWKMQDDSGSLHTTTVNMAGLGTGIGTLTVSTNGTSGWPTRGTLGICQTAGTNQCSGSGASTEEYITYEVLDASHIKLLARGVRFTLPITYTDSATIVNSSVTRPPKSCFNIIGTSDPVTTGGLDVFEQAGGCLQLTNVEFNGSNRTAFIGDNATSTIFLGNRMSSIQLLYEDITAFNSMSGCGNTLQIPQAWSCYSPSPISPPVVANQTIDGSSRFWQCNASGGNVTLTVFTAVSLPSIDESFEKTDSSANVCIIQLSGGDTFTDGSTAYYLYGQGQRLITKNDGVSVWQ